MPNDVISKITLPDGTTFNIEDSSIYDWARAATKPSYTATQVGAAAASHNHGDITSTGDITTSSTIASGDRLVINDQSASKVTNSSIVFGNSSTQYLANDGTWQNVPSGGSSYTEGSGIDITNDVISVESNLTVTGDTLNLEYAATPYAPFSVQQVDFTTYINAGVAVQSDEDLEDLGIDLDLYTPIGVVGWNGVTTSNVFPSKIYVDQHTLYYKLRNTNTGSAYNFQLIVYILCQYIGN